MVLATVSVVEGNELEAIYAVTIVEGSMVVVSAAIKCRLKLCGKLKIQRVMSSIKTIT